MPFNPLVPFNDRLAFHTSLYLAFRERGRVQKIHAQVYGAEAKPFFWLDDLNFGARFGPRGDKIEQNLNPGADPANMKLKKDHNNPTGCTFVSGLSVANRCPDVWQAPLALALGMKPNGRSRGRFMIKQETKGPIWLGHRGGLSGGGAGGIRIPEFHDQLPGLNTFLHEKPQLLKLIDGLEQAQTFDQIFACRFLPDDLSRPQQGPQRVFPIAAYDGTEKFFQMLASYVHQCYVLRCLRQEGKI